MAIWPRNKKSLFSGGRCPYKGSDGEKGRATCDKEITPGGQEDSNSWDARAKVPFRYYENGSPFEYETVRLLYTQGRKVLIGE